MKNVEELRSNLSEVFENLKSGTIKPNEAAEFSNIAGKMINSAKVELEYYALRKETPDIKFLSKNEDGK